MCIRDRNINSPRRPRLVSAAVNPAMEIDESTFQAGFIPLPRNAVNARCGSSLQSVEAFPEQSDRHMVEQSGELHPLPFLRCSAHTRQPLGHANLALCRGRAGLMSVLLDQRPSLPVSYTHLRAHETVLDLVC